MSDAPLSAPDQLDGHTPMWRVWLAGLVLTLIGLGVYWNALDGPFIFDDDHAIVENEHIHRLLPLTESMSAPPQSSASGRPLVSLSLAINYAIGKLDTHGYHVFNLIIHLCASLVLFGVLRRTLLHPQVQRTLRIPADSAAFLIALIWLIHPLQTEVINYTIQRTESMMGVFYLLTLYCAIRSRTISSMRIPWMALAVVASLCGGLCKESIVTAPFLVILYDVAFPVDSHRTTDRKRWPFYAALACTWILVGFIISTGPRSDSVGFNEGISAWTYVKNQAVVVGEYLHLTFWPDTLAIDYGIPQPISLRNTLPSGFAIVGLMGLTLVAWTRWRTAAFALSWFFITLAPTSSLIPISTEVGAERRMYLPLAGLLAVIVCGVWSLLRRLTMSVTFSRNDDHRAVPYRLFGIDGAISVVSIVVLVALTSRTMLRNKEYAKSVSIWETAVAAKPANSRAHTNLGEAYAASQQFNKAIESFQRAIELDSNAVTAHWNLGAAFVRVGAIDEAIMHLEIATQQAPEEPRAFYNLGEAYMAARPPRPTDAEQAYLRATELDPTDAKAFNGLTIVLRARHDIAGAIDAAETAAALSNESIPEIMANLAMTYVHAHRLDDAEPAMVKAIDLAQAQGKPPELIDMMKRDLGIIRGKIRPNSE